MEAWITADPTNYLTVTQVKANATQLWGPGNIAGNETRVIGWDESAALFHAAGRRS